MKSADALRKELKAYIDGIPARRLSALRPLLADLAGDTGHWESVIEPANSEETALIDERMKGYYNDPASFLSL
jgi:hypothetical protein